MTLLLFFQFNPIVLYILLMLYLFAFLLFFLFLFHLVYRMASSFCSFKDTVQCHFGIDLDDVSKQFL
jgi:hypothetical protein